MSTTIITTIGPSCLNDTTLSFFKNHSVEYARLNFSHSSSQWHIDAGKQCRENGLKLLMDLGGPKIRLGVLQEDTKIENGAKIALEHTKESSYPYKLKSGVTVLPVAVDLAPALAVGRQILVDDGKLDLVVDAIEGEHIFCTVRAGGVFRSRKGVNLPESSLAISFLTDRDKQMLRETLKDLQPDVIASSFVKTKADIDMIKDYIHQIIQEEGIDNSYFPLICAKLEQHELFVNGNLEEIIDASDILMIARGDLALEVTPAHVILPFLQERIIRACKKAGKPFVVATQILETMISTPVPTRAEVSDLYRAVVLDEADFIMLSGESAMGEYPIQCVQLMDDMIQNHTKYQAEILG